VTGFRYLVNEPGKGVTIRDVGRIVYNNLDESSWRDLAGQHEFANTMPRRANSLRCHCLISLPVAQAAIGEQLVDLRHRRGRLWCVVHAADCCVSRTTLG